MYGRLERGAGPRAHELRHALRRPADLERVVNLDRRQPRDGAGRRQLRGAALDVQRRAAGAVGEPLLCEQLRTGGGLAVPHGHQLDGLGGPGRVEPGADRGGERAKKRESRRRQVRKSGPKPPSAFA